VNRDWFAGVPCPQAAPHWNLEVMSMSKRVIIVSALAAAIAAPSLVMAQGGPAPAPTFKAEKCYGLAKAGKNDCASTGNNSCAGTSKVNADKKAWIYVPEGYCDRIVGGSKSAA
jgi:uncharacterized membrane protein